MWGCLISFGRSTFEIVRKFNPPKTAPKSVRLVAEWVVSFQEGDLRKKGW